MREKSEVFLRNMITELQVAEREAKQANEAKSSFLASMSHELRTPLTAIIGYTELIIEDGNPDPETEADLGRILRSGQHLLALVNDVLDLSKIEAGHYELHPSCFDLRELVEDVIEVVRPMSNSRDNYLEVRCPTIELVADEKAVRQCLLNLLSNSAKFTSAGTIELMVSHTSSVVELVVQDTGVGMSPDELALVFDEFTTTKSSQRANASGTGLGLPITRRLCELMGGSISAESTEGVGSRFSIVLPRRASEQSAA